ncbi:unnamed protein product [Scytosiphon promiscuus]
MAKAQGITAAPTPRFTFGNPSTAAAGAAAATPAAGFAGVGGTQAGGFDGVCDVEGVPAEASVRASRKSPPSHDPSLGLSLGDLGKDRGTRLDGGAGACLKLGGIASPSASTPTFGSPVGDFGEGASTSLTRLSESLRPAAAAAAAATAAPAAETRAPPLFPPAMAKAQGITAAPTPRFTFGIPSTAAAGAAAATPAAGFAGVGRAKAGGFKGLCDGQRRSEGDFKEETAKSHILTSIPTPRFTFGVASTRAAAGPAPAPVAGFGGVGRTQTGGLGSLFDGEGVSAEASVRASRKSPPSHDLSPRLSCEDVGHDGGARRNGGAGACLNLGGIASPSTSTPTLGPPTTGDVREGASILLTLLDDSLRPAAPAAAAATAAPAAETRAPPLFPPATAKAQGITAAPTPRFTFGAASAAAKPAAVFGGIGRTQAGGFKGLSGGDGVSAEHQHQQAIIPDLASRSLEGDDIKGADQLGMERSRQCLPRNPSDTRCSPARPASDGIGHGDGGGCGSGGKVNRGRKASEVAGGPDRAPAAGGAAAAAGEAVGASPSGSRLMERKVFDGRKVRSLRPDEVLKAQELQAERDAAKRKESDAYLREARETRIAEEVTRASMVKERMAREKMAREKMRQRREQGRQRRKKEQERQPEKEEEQLPQQEQSTAAAGLGSPEGTAVKGEGTAVCGAPGSPLPEVS